MSNTITAEEYRRMMGKKTAQPTPKFEKGGPEPKTGKLTVEEAVRQVVLMLDLDQSQINKAEYVINQLRINGKL